jgi:hypothetical protein
MKLTSAFIAVAAVLGVIIAQSGTATGRGGQTSITLHAGSKLQQAKYVDHPPAGRSAGDELVFTERLLKPNGQPMGSDAASCSYLFDQRSLCTGVYALPAGQIMVQLVQPGLSAHRTYDQSIVGGTRAYARASGSVSVDQRPTGDRFTFHIRLPG